MIAVNKQAKKLTLGRETVVTLNPDQLAHVLGGAIEITKGNSCCLLLSCRTVKAG
jgi:hypothetical protein